MWVLLQRFKPDINSDLSQVFSIPFTKTDQMQNISQLRVIYTGVGKQYTGTGARNIGIAPARWDDAELEWYNSSHTGINYQTRSDTGSDSGSTDSNTIRYFSISWSGQSPDNDRNNHANGFVDLYDINQGNDFLHLQGFSQCYTSSNRYIRSVNFGHRIGPGASGQWRIGGISFTSYTGTAYYGDDFDMDGNMEIIIYGLLRKPNKILNPSEDDFYNTKGEDKLYT